MIHPSHPSPYYHNIVMTDYLQAQLLCAETDIHAVAGLLKKYFRELPEPLFTNALYPNFVDGLCKYFIVTAIIL